MTSPRALLEQSKQLEDDDNDDDDTDDVEDAVHGGIPLAGAVPTDDGEMMPGLRAGPAQRWSGQADISLYSKFRFRFFKRENNRSC
jgi:hypothetical protein